jgi:membrane protease YdiL (CAAX protease family)
MSARGRRSGALPFPASLGLTVAVLTTANVLAHQVIPDADAAVAVGLVGSLAGVAAASRLTADDLGLSRRNLGSGARWGGIAAAAVVMGYGVAALIPAAREAVPAPDSSWGQALLRAFVLIPLVTVIPEEFAFRGVLWGLLKRQSGRRWATGVSSALFGLWHVSSALSGGAANESVSGVVGGGTTGTVLRVVGTVLFTGAAGVLFALMRDRSGSLLAPIGLHWAVNGCGELWLQLTAR